MESLRAAAVQCSAAGAGAALEQAGARVPPQVSLESSMRGQQCARLGLERKALSGSRASASTRQRGAVKAMAGDGEGGFSSSSPQSSGAGKTRSVATGAGGPSPTMIRSDPRHEKLMKMQKELLEQLEERRKLHAALLQSLDDPASTIKEFNESNRGGLPPVGPVTAAAPEPPAAAPPPPQASAAAAPPAAPAATARAAAQVKPATSPISVPIPSAPSRQRTGAVPAPAAAPAAAAAPAPPPAPARAKTPPPPAAYAAPPRVNPRAAATPASPVAAPKSAAAAPPAPKAAPAAPKVAPPPAPIITPKVEPKASKGPVFKAPPAPAPVAEKPAEKLWAEVVQAAPSEPPVEEPPPPLAGPNVMNIVMVASECAPWSKTGGLGDVVGALPKALARRGHRVMVCVPRYGNYPEAVDMSIRKRYNVAGQDCEVGYFHHYRDGVDFVFVDNNMYHHHEKNIYGGSREEVAKRMILLCKAAIEAPWHVPCGGVCYGDGNLVFIANDWHTALLPVYLQAYYRDNGLMQFTRSVLVIHNMAHQGRGPVAEYPWLGLPEHYLNRFKLYDPMGGEHMNVFMAGIISAHKIVAVSHGYAWEIQTQMGGWGLDAVLRDHNQKLRGVVNGIDVQEWSPECDQHLLSDGYVQYSMETLDDKAKCKAALQRELGLPERPDVPLLGFIGRLDYQKGVDIIGEAMPWITSQDCQVVLLGTGRADLEDMLRQFEGSHREKVRGWVGFSVQMAHRITAGSDILLMPSRFEPCGLNQLYAMRYGTVPVVHAVGGLRDTVQAFDPFNDAGLGWTFDKAEANGLIHALGNCMYTYKEFKESWRKLQLRGMSQDLSWDNAAAQYEEILVQAKYIW